MTTKINEGNTTKMKIQTNVHKNYCIVHKSICCYGNREHMSVPKAAFP